MKTLVDFAKVIFSDLLVLTDLLIRLGKLMPNSELPSDQDLAGINPEAAPTKDAGDMEVTVDRRRAARRSAEESLDAADGLLSEELDGQEEEGQSRRKTQRRRQIDPTTCERDYSGDEIEFMRALDDYKRNNGRMFPTCSEILEVVRALGYVRLSEDEISILDSIQQVEDDLAEAAIETNLDGPELPAEIANAAGESSEDTVNLE